jgi:hypothetical protein
VNATGPSRDFPLIRVHNATVGATDGNIIAVIMTIETPRNQPNVPRPVHGPSSMPRIFPRRSTTTRFRRARRGRPRVPTERGLPRTRNEDRCRRTNPPTRSRSCRQAVHEKSDFDNPVFPSYSMPKALILDRVASAIVRSDPTGWNIPENLTGSPVSTPNGTMSSISKSITSPIRTLWCNPSSSTWITALDAQHLADQRGKPGHRSTQLAAEDLDELVELRVRRAVVDDTPTRQLPSVITFGVSAMRAALHPAMSVPSTAPSRILKTRVTRQKSYVAP